MTKLSIDFVETTDTVWEHFLFAQEGMQGLRLAGACLLDFVQALQGPFSSEPFWFWETLNVINTKSGVTVRKSAMPVPLLQLDANQRDKLLAHLHEHYSHLL